MKKNIFITVIILSCVFSLKAQYVAVDKTNIEDKIPNYLKEDNKKELTNLVAIYKIYINPNLSPKFDNTLKESLLRESNVLDVVENNSNSEFLLYTKYDTSPSTIKDILYKFNFKIKDYSISYTTKN